MIQIVENFESAAVISRTGTWEESATSPYIGNRCLKSADIGDDEFSEVVIDITGATSIQFAYRVSSESDYDELFVYHESFTNGVVTIIDALSGDTNWEIYTSPTGFLDSIDSSETQRLRFKYIKDGSVSENGDAAFIDQLIIETEFIVYSGSIAKLSQAVENRFIALGVITQVSQAVHLIETSKKVVDLSQSVENRFIASGALIGIAQSSVILGGGLAGSLSQAVRVNAQGELFAIAQMVEFRDWEKFAPIERRNIYLFTVGDLQLPISSFQATMRVEGQSYLQVIVPAGFQYSSVLASSYGLSMMVRKGFLYTDGSLSPLELIATAPLEIVRGDWGPTSDSLTLSGYGALEPAAFLTRDLRNVRYRSLSGGSRRVRCDIDLFLRPGHTAIDSDGTELSVSVIQYFVGARSDFMEVIDNG